MIHGVAIVELPILVTCNHQRHAWLEKHAHWSITAIGLASIQCLGDGGGSAFFPRDMGASIVSRRSGTCWSSKQPQALISAMFANAIIHLMFVQGKFANLPLR